MPDKHRIIYGAIAIAAILGAAAILFGATGIRAVGAILALYVFPFYLILDSFDLEEGEKIIFSLFIGMVMFSLITWYVNRIIVSLKVSVIVTFIVLVIIGLGLKLGIRKKEKRKPK